MAKFIIIDIMTRDKIWRYCWPDLVLEPGVWDLDLKDGSGVFVMLQQDVNMITLLNACQSSVQTTY